MLALIGLFVKLASLPPVAVRRSYDSKALILGYLCRLERVIVAPVVRAQIGGTCLLFSAKSCAVAAASAIL